VDANEKIYVANQLSVYSYDLEDNSIQRFSKVNGLSDIGMSTIAYNSQKDILLMAYSNSNIDLLTGNQIRNFSFIKQASIVGDKSIYNIHFKGDSAYLACGFGIVVLDVEANESPATYSFNTDQGTRIRVNDVTTNDDKVFAATEKGIYVASLTNPLLEDFSNWTLQETATGLPEEEALLTLNFRDTTLALISDTLYKYTGSAWEIYYADPGWEIAHAEVHQNQLTLIHLKTGELPKVRIIDQSNQSTDLTDATYLVSPQEAMIDNSGVVWVADLIRGLVKMDGANVTSINPNSPGSSKVYSMAIQDDRVWVAPGSVTPAWSLTYNRDGFFEFKNESWRTHNVFNQPALDTVLDILAVAVNPNGDKFYLGSYGGGLVEFDGNNLTVYNLNSSLQGAAGDESNYRVSGLAFDAAGHLWMANDGAGKPISVLKNDGTWHAFDAGISSYANSVGPLIIDELGRKWFVMPRDNGILVYDHGENIDNAADDQVRKLGSGAGNGNLHTLQTRCIAIDLDGEIWVGTTSGISVFYNPYEVFSSNGFGDASQIIVELDGFGEFLLGNEVVNSIAIDGGNRKWMGTNNGVFLISEDGTDQLRHFTAENSPLLSNTVLSIEINHNNGEVFFGTGNGIISYKGEATGGEITQSEVVVYPNPVRENYAGPIAIRGLVNNADVKITDVSGTLIFETQALGGQAIWDGNNVNGQRAKTGVYLIFSTNEDGSETNVGKVLVVN
jgi:hypothetical protein